MASRDIVLNITIVQVSNVEVCCMCVRQIPSREIPITKIASINLAGIGCFIAGINWCMAGINCLMVSYKTGQYLLYIKQELLANQKTILCKNQIINVDFNRLLLLVKHKT